MDQPVLFVGDVNVDLILSGLRQDPVPDREVLASNFEVAIGSSAAIAAVAHACLGGPTAFCGVAGDDEYGRFMKVSLGQAGVDVSGIRLDPALRTGVTVNLVREKARTQVTFGGAIPFLDVEAEELLRQGPRHVHFAGIYQQPRLLRHLGQVLESLRRAGVTTSVDPQWDETELWEFSEVWLGMCDLVFVNAEEARSISKAQSTADATRRLGQRCRTVIIKDGAEGAHLREGTQELSVRGVRVPLIDSIGAGDNFAAGYLWSRYVRGGGVEESLRFANAVAARSCTFAGGTGARSTVQDIDQFVKEQP